MSVDVRTRRTRALARFSSRFFFIYGMALSPKGDAVLIRLERETLVVGLRGGVRLRLPGIRDAVWSPDGTQLAVVRPYAPGALRGEVWIVSLSGHRRRLVPGLYSFPEWLSGGWIALERRHSRYEQTLWLVRSDGRGLRRLRGWYSADWSPSGRRVIRWRPSQQLYELWTFDTRAGHPGRRYGQLWSDENEESPAFGSLDLGWIGDRWVRFAAGARITTVLGKHSAHRPPVAPDGRRVVFDSRWACRTSRLWIADLQSARATRLTRGC